MLRQLKRTATSAVDIQNLRDGLSAVRTKVHQDHGDQAIYIDYTCGIHVSAELFGLVTVPFPDRKAAGTLQLPHHGVDGGGGNRGYLTKSVMNVKHLRGHHSPLDEQEQYGDDASHAMVVTPLSWKSIESIWGSHVEDLDTPSDIFDISSSLLARLEASSKTLSYQVSPFSFSFSLDANRSAAHAYFAL